MASYPEIRDLQMLLVLSQRKHFTQAAKEFGISQPAFSARIRHLEEELGVPIVRRGNKFLGFTPDGELVLKWASRILADSEGLRQDIEIAKGSLRGTLVLGVVPTALTYAADLATALRNSYPALAIHIQSLSSVQIARGLLDYSVDAGITYQDECENRPLLFDSIYQEQYELLVPSQLAPRKRGQASWAEAASIPLCLLSKDMHFRQIVDDAFHQAAVSPDPVMETNAFTAALAQVANGSAATVAPSMLVDSMLLDRNTIRLSLIAPIVGHAIGLAAPDHEPSLPAISALRRAIAAHHK